MIEAPVLVEHHYPSDTVRALLDTDLVTPPTASVLRRRMADKPLLREDLLGALTITLDAVCARLIPQSGINPPIDIADALHARLAELTGDGWRYANMPIDAVAWRQGLEGIDDTASVMFNNAFANLSSRDQDAVLHAVQAGSPSGATWQTLHAARFFEELLAAAVDVFYAHPLAQQDVGYAGMADAQGWHAIGLDEREQHEPIESVAENGNASF